MPAAHGERIVCVGAPARAPRLSVLTPFHRHNPSTLIAALGRPPRDVEFVLLDDGSGSAALLADVISAAARSGAPARVIVWPDNRGRAAARNRLAEAAHGEYVLYLDADMMPDSARFLENWLGVIQTQRPYIAFGGLSAANVTTTPETALHHAMFARSDCRPARERARNPVQSLATANLLVRRDVLNARPFDDRFTGWGFEDVDWALTASAHAPILHVDNQASHLGLDDIDALMRKCAQAGPNFARLAAKHPRQVRRFAAHRAARALKLAPARRALRGIFAWIARDPMAIAPMRLRSAAFKLYRASHYAEHLA